MIRVILKNALPLTGSHPFRRLFIAATDIQLLDLPHPLLAGFE